MQCKNYEVAERPNDEIVRKYWLRKTISRGKTIQ